MQCSHFSLVPPDVRMPAFISLAVCRYSGAMEFFSADPTRSWRRFSLRTALLAVAVAAIAGWWMGERFFRQETVSLADAVAAFNEEAAVDLTGATQRPLTETELLTAIARVRPQLADPRDVAVFDAITASHRIPATAKILSINRFQDRAGAIKHVWWINLQIIHNDGLGYGLRIRENNDP